MGNSQVLHLEREAVEGLSLGDGVVHCGCGVEDGDTSYSESNVSVHCNPLNSGISFYFIE